jgi:hypothetical protein
MAGSGGKLSASGRKKISRPVFQGGGAECMPPESLKNLLGNLRYIWVKYTCTWILGAINVKKEHRKIFNYTFCREPT